MKGKRWTKEEIEYLNKWWGKKDRIAIAKHLNKSVAAVKGQVNTQGLGSFLESNEYLNAVEVSKLLGVQESTIRKWTSRGLPCKKFPMYVMFDEKDVLKFMQENPDSWDARKCDYWYFQTFPWFREKLAKDRERKSYYYKNWTDYELQRLQTMKRRGYTNRQIADELGRTKRSVVGKTSYLRSKGVSV